MSEEKTAPKPVVEKPVVEKPATKKKTTKVEAAKEGLIAVVLIRGPIGVNGKVVDTLSMLSLHKKNFCSVQKGTPSIRGMIQKIKDYVTWGEISDEVLKELIKERSEPNPKDEKKTKKFFRLNSPKRGYGRKGIKVPFSKGGALGYRGDKINDLIKRML